jgi:molecular chaperone HtpG
MIAPSHPTGLDAAGYRRWHASKRPAGTAEGKAFRNGKKLARSPLTGQSGMLRRDGLGFFSCVGRRPAAIHQGPPMPKMKSDFKGLVILLAKNLYQEPDVFLRELIQNAHDSIQLRLLEESVEPGRITLSIDPLQHTITIEDNGLGMDRRVIEDFLSTIGASGTRAMRRQHEEQDGISVATIGQFGIGLLSAFVVAQRVDVFTRRRGSEEAWHWVNQGDDEYTLEPTGEMPRAGTQVVVTLTPAHLGFLNRKEIVRAVRKYADFLSVPIVLEGEGQINTPDPEWFRSGWSADIDVSPMMPWVQRRYGDNPLLLIPVALEAPRTRGLLFITDRRFLGPQDAGHVDIYQNRMFIRARDTDLLPEWAAFVRGFIDTADVQPTAARDNLRRDDAWFELRRQLGTLVIRALLRLAENDPDYFRSLCSWHNYHLKRLSLEDQAFFEAIVRRLPFATSEGPMNLDEYLERHARHPDTRNRIYYLCGDTIGTQLQEICRSQGITVIRAEARIEETLLERFVQTVYPGLELRKIDESSWQHLYRRLMPDEERAFDPLVSAVTRALRHAGIDDLQLHVRHIRPEHLAAILMKSPEWDSHRDLRLVLQHPFFFRSLENFARKGLDASRPPPLEFILNADCALIQKLARLPVLDAPENEPLFRSLYFAALVDARREMSEDDIRALQQVNQALLQQVVTARWDRFLDERGGPSALPPAPAADSQPSIPEQP